MKQLKGADGPVFNPFFSQRERPGQVSVGKLAFSISLVLLNSLPVNFLPNYKFLMNRGIL